MTDTQEAPEALYNRYRPRRLSDLVGQDHVALPLRRAFEKGRIHHAYLLSGPRGCGKTSTARILAAGLVCEAGPTADPCNACGHCRAVITGNHLDVTELDAATHGRVDDARELREKAHFSPVTARYKVIVIDEAHMVTKEGFNALLKLIEEPPGHVRFIFATTDPDKVLATIRSRTYHYSFRLVPAAALADHLTGVVATEGCTLEEGVLPLVVRAGGGSVRDSLAVLGQLLDGSDAGTVRLDEAAALLGTTNDSVLDDTIAALAERDTARLLSTIAAAIDSGTDPRRLAEDLLDLLRDLLFTATTGTLPPFAEIAGPDRKALWQTVTQRLGMRGLTVACEVLQTAVATMHSGQPRITLEVAAARILLNLADTVDVAAALDGLTRQVANLQQHGARTSPVPVPDDEWGPTRFTTPATPSADPTVGPRAQSGPAQPTTKDLALLWERLLGAVAERRRSTWMGLRSSADLVAAENHTLVLSTNVTGFAEGFRSGGHDQVFLDAATDILGGTWTVEVRSR